MARKITPDKTGVKTFGFVDETAFRDDKRQRIYCDALSFVRKIYA